MSTLIEILPKAVFAYGVAGSLLVVIVYACLKLIPTNATTRHSIWLMCMGILCMLPIMMVMPNWFSVDGLLNKNYQSLNSKNVHVQNQKQIGALDKLSDEGYYFSADAQSLSPTNSVSAAAQSEIPTPNRFDGTTLMQSDKASLFVGKILLLGFVVGLLIKLSLFISALFKIKSIYKKSHSINDFRLTRLERIVETFGIRAIPTFRESDDVTSPMTAGLFRVWVLLPKSFGLEESEADLLDQVLLHELAHVRRRDTLIATIQSVLGMFLFWHPAYYFINKNIVEDRELAADDWVVKTMGNFRENASVKGSTNDKDSDQTHYADTLITVAKQVVTTKQQIPVVACIGSAKQLRHRVQHLLNKEGLFSVNRAWLSILTVTLSLVAGASFSSPLWPILLFDNGKSIKALVETHTVPERLVNQTLQCDIDGNQTDFDIATYQADNLQEDKAEPLSTLNWKTVDVKPGDNLSTIFKDARIAHAVLLTLLKNEDAQTMSASLKPGQTLVFGLNEEWELQQLQWQKNKLESVLYDQQDFAYQSYPKTIQPTISKRYADGRIQRNLFDTAKSVGMQAKVIHELAELFAWDINLAKDIRPGDSFKILYEELFLNNKFVGTGKILAAEFVNRDQAYHAVQYTDKNGDGSYYNLQGVNMRSTFLQAPLDYRRVSSHFNPRRLHPISKTIRAHRGTDYAAEVGTPIWAVGDGIVVQSGYSHSNGNFVVLQHGQKYQTKYLHLSERLVKVGEQVSQKQTIGKVGATGLATGPHLHYEFLVDGVHKDSREIQKSLPTINIIAERERERFQLMSTDLMSQLKPLVDSQNNKSNNVAVLEDIDNEV